MEIQEELQRFATQFLERTNQAMIPIMLSNDPIAKNIAMHQVLRLSSSALEIATGPRAEMNLLDMMAFVRLNQDALRDHWVPKVYKASGENLLTAFADSERDITAIANERLTPEQRSTFDRLLQSWREENPNFVMVEGVRLTDFAKHAGIIERNRSEQIDGLISGIKGAVSTADQAILLANRAIFLGQRMPFLLRLQARIGVQEILTDSMKQFSSVGEITDKSNEFTQNLSDVLTQLNEAMRQAGPLLKEYRQNFPYDPNSTLGEKLTTANQTVVELRKLVSDLSSLSTSEVQKGTREIRQQMNELIWDAAKALALIGSLLIGLWWLGYYLVKRKRAH